jgi:hydrogenase maturation protease
MADILIIGYGNPLRGDDGVGVHAAQTLGRSVHDETVKVLSQHQLSPDLASDLAEARAVLFIDANSEGAPGTLKVETITPDTSYAGSFSHHLQPSVLLALTQTLYGKCPKTLLFSIAGKCFDHVEGLSEEVRTVLPMLYENVLKAADEFRNK